MPNNSTTELFFNVFDTCREVFELKLIDYGASWRILRPKSVTDQIFIKAQRIRTIEESKVQLVDDNILDEFVAIVNYGIVGLIQRQKGYSNAVDISPEEAVHLYNSYAQQVIALMQNKNHDYGEAWRSMRISSFTDLILTKLLRIKQIEENAEQTIISEGIDSGIQDIINYAIFAIIRLTNFSSEEESEE